MVIMVTKNNDDNNNSTSSNSTSSSNRVGPRSSWLVSPKDISQLKKLCFLIYYSIIELNIL